MWYPCLPQVWITPAYARGVTLSTLQMALPADGDHTPLAAGEYFGGESADNPQTEDHPRLRRVSTKTHGFSMELDRGSPRLRGEYYL